MSGGKITIRAGGKITKTCNEYSLYTNNLTLSSNGTISLTCDGEMTFGEPEPCPPQELRAQLAVHFRPCKDWKGEYGFDWMRKGDLEHIQGKTVFGDMDYRRLITKQYIKGTQTLETEPNTYTGDFKQDDLSYRTLKNSYGIYGIPWRKNEEGIETYFKSWLSLFPKKVDGQEAKYPNTEAKLSLLLDVEEAADKIIFDYNEDYFKVTPKEIDVKAYKKQDNLYALVDVITIECLTDFAQDQKIEVYANDKRFRQNLVGELRVWANDESKRKKVKILPVKVELSSISGKDPLVVEDLSEQLEAIKIYFPQALMEAEFMDTIELNLKDDEHLRAGGLGIKNYRVLDAFDAPDKESKFGMNKPHFLVTILHDALKKNKNYKSDYDDAQIVFYIAEKGYNDGFNSSFIQVIFGANEKDASTSCHEVLHGLGLPHSFTNSEADKKALYTYQILKTENIMDYSHGIPQKRYSLWKWQWDILDQNFKRV